MAGFGEQQITSSDAVSPALLIPSLERYRTLAFARACVIFLFMRARVRDNVRQ